MQIAELVGTVAMPECEYRGASHIANPGRSVCIDG
jgi:hypothetical protein